MMKKNKCPNCEKQFVSQYCPHCGLSAEKCKAAEDNPPKSAKAATSKKNPAAEKPAKPPAAAAASETPPASPPAAKPEPPLHVSNESFLTKVFRGIW